MTHLADLAQRVYAKSTLPFPQPDCWEWQGVRNWAGYGVVRDGPKSYYVHRIAYSEAYGPIPARACVLHLCDNRVCVRPSHLRLGTRRDNSADMVAKGRSGKGEAHSQAILSEVQVRAILACQKADLTQQETAAAFGISRSMVGMIWQRKRWGHVA